VVLADGVGLGKTYEALATVATFLSQRQHGKERTPKKLRILILVPPRLMTKWSDELLLPDRFRKYMEGWDGTCTGPVARTFDDVVLLRNGADLQRQKGQRRYHKVQLPRGLYLVNSNLLGKAGQKITQIHSTQWDAVIVDEAHHSPGALFERQRCILGDKKTVAVLLTATPFQLAPQELKRLLRATAGGHGHATCRKSRESAETFYKQDSFKTYREHVARYFRDGNEEARREAARVKSDAETHVRTKILRTRHAQNRRYHFVDGQGQAQPVGANLFHLDDAAMDRVLAESALIDLDTETAALYLDLRQRLCAACSSDDRPFVAGTLRQLLSSYGQFRRCSFAQGLSLQNATDNEHPKVRAAAALVGTLLGKEKEAAGRRGFVGKVLVFTTYVGAERNSNPPTEEEAYGTARVLKQALAARVKALFPKASPEIAHAIREDLLGVLPGHSTGLSDKERKALETTIRRFAGTPLAGVLLAKRAARRREAELLSQMLDNIKNPAGERGSLATPNDEEEPDSEEVGRRESARRGRLLQAVYDRYTTRDLVARYDGAVNPEDRDRHLRGFNSPYAPLVLIASSVGQEGIDLQRYCCHVLHYDLEWNPAKVEQREGRVDRQGREKGLGPVNVYFLICRGTYDERILHVMVNRLRWHHVLLANRSALQKSPDSSGDGCGKARVVRKLALDLAPRKRGL